VLPCSTNSSAPASRDLSNTSKLSRDIGYYQLVAAFVLSLINNRLAVLLVRDRLDQATARSYPQASVGLVERYLQQL
jgi:hypothetical protein